MNKSSNLALNYKPIRLKWITAERDEIIFNNLALLVSKKQGMTLEKAWNLYLVHRIGFIAPVATIGRVWSVRDCPMFGDETISMEIISLSAN